MAIKLLDRDARFEVISEHDSALIKETDEEMEEIKKSGGQTRYQKYQESLNLSDLKINPDSEPPTIFVVRALLQKERSDLIEKSLTIDPQTKAPVIKNMMHWFLQHYDIGCEGIKREDGSVLKVSEEDVGIVHASSVGSVISNITILGKNLKNV